MHIIKSLMGMTILMIMSATVIGQAIPSKGMSAIEYSGRSPSSSDKSAVIADATFNAIERYVASSNTSNQKNFDLLRDEIREDLDQYILGYSLVSEDNDKDANRLTVVLRADINASRLENALQTNSAVGSAAEMEKSYITFVFVAREQAEVQSFDDKVYSRVDTSNSEDGAAYQAGSQGGIEYAEESRSTQTRTTGGSTTKKTDKVRYNVANASEINSVMTGVLSTRGFQVVEAEYLQAETGGLLNVDQFMEDFSRGDDISGHTRRNAVKGAKLVDVPYLALGTIDIGMEDQDPVSGLTRVYVKVAGKVVSVAGRFPKTVASVGPAQYAGLGPNRDVARTNALKLAAENAAKEMVDQLDAKGIY